MEINSNNGIRQYDKVYKGAIIGGAAGAGLTGGILKLSEYGYKRAININPDVFNLSDILYNQGMTYQEYIDYAKKGLSQLKKVTPKAICIVGAACAAIGGAIGLGIKISKDKKAQKETTLPSNNIENNGQIK